MKATHRLKMWFRWNGTHKFEATLRTFRCRFKKDGTLMVWRGIHRVCMGPYPPSLFYFENYGDWEKPQRAKWKGSMGDYKKYQFYYKLEEL